MLKPVSISCLTDHTGVLVFEKDVALKNVPISFIQNQELKLSACPKEIFAKKSGYYIEGNHVTFFLHEENLPSHIDTKESLFFVCGAFNNWQKNTDFELRWDPEQRAWTLKVARRQLPQYSFAFKFVTSLNQWIEPSDHFLNTTIDEYGNKNLFLDFEKTGNHLVFFHVKNPLILSQPIVSSFEVPINLDPWLLSLYTHEKLGVYIENGKTFFACFAPKAKRVEVELHNHANKFSITLKQTSPGFWRGESLQNFTDYTYLFNIWDPKKHSLVDPYAVALASPRGPGIIMDLGHPSTDNFQTPALKDLIILEVHAKDLVANATTPKDVSIFAQLNDYFSKPNYVKDLGVNCIEFMPLTEFDNDCKTTYQWGYMPAHFFAISSCYGTPHEFINCVQTIHNQGLAVILDVVYNHAGTMNDLLQWDKNFYFRHTSDGQLTNVSGCGNDLRTDFPMARKLILDSLLHWIKTYNIDGFRFDLAEILGVQTLHYLSENLKNFKKNIILIAEPWSFCGHIAYALKGSDYTCWNDGYREFLLKYVTGNGNCDGFKYFLEGSTAFLCQNAQQSINYTESHDDYCWRDRLSLDENIALRQTHCMFAILLLSLGIPMIAEGQDFMRSKQRIRNTYNRGDLNLLNYDDLNAHSITHNYVKALLNFRKSSWGHLLKIGRPSAHYFKYFYVENTSAIGVLFNADFSLGSQQILFLINPHNFCVEFNLNSIETTAFSLVADTLNFSKDTLKRNLSLDFRLDPISCNIFVRD